MENMTANFTTAKPRRVRWEGREWLVSPVVLIRSQTLFGSDGPLYYPAEEICKSAKQWEMKPVTIGHPAVGLRPVGVDSPGVLQRQGVGVVRNVKCCSGRLTGEAWFDENRLRVVRPDLARDLESGRAVECSTGLFCTKNNGTVSSIVADHLAVLVDGQIGACSLRDGCGVGVANKENRMTRRFAWDAQALAGGLPTVNKHDTLDVPEIDWGEQACVNNEGRTNVANATPVSVGPGDPLPSVDIDWAEVARNNQ